MQTPELHCFLTHPQPAPAQAKQGGRKVVAVLSSGEASVGGVAADARDQEKQLRPTDVMQPAYRPSKAALNRCAPHTCPSCCSRDFP